MIYTEQKKFTSDALLSNICETHISLYHAYYYLKVWSFCCTTGDSSLLFKHMALSMML